MVKIRLDAAIDEILDSVVTKLTAAIGTGKLLEGVKDVVRGDRARPKPEMPSIWIFTETLMPAHSPRALAETWEMPIVLTPILKSLEPADGYKQATILAAKARSAVLAGRNLGLRPFVQDVKSGRFEPSAPWHREDTIYSAVAVVTVVFTIIEDII